MMLIPAAILASFLMASAQLGDPTTRCRSFESDICTAWNSTTFPNILKHANAMEANSYVNDYFDHDGQPFINCHPFLKQFLCMTTFPFCQNEYTVKPCRSFCEEVYEKCSCALEAAGLKWPDELNCNVYPNSSTCYSPPSTQVACPSCQIRVKSQALKSLLAKDMPMYAHVRITETHFDSCVVYYDAHLITRYKPSRMRGGAADNPTPIRIVTDYPTNCPRCVVMKRGVEYLVGGEFKTDPFGVKSIYILPRNAPIKKWNTFKPGKVERILGPGTD